MSDRIEVGPFELGEKIGEGGMGSVYRGQHGETDVEVAIKVIGPWLKEDALEKFHREVQSQAALIHPGIVYLFEYGRIPEQAAAASAGTLRAQGPYVAMELADFGTLRDLPDADRWEVIYPALVQVFEALAFAHSRNVLHRDLKPENLLLFEVGEGELRVKLADFGLAHVLGEEGERETHALRSASGTPQYIAPEQTRGLWRNYGPWTDLYALGCIAWEMVCGHPPFLANSPFQTMLKHSSADRPALEPECSVPDGLENWIHRCMAVDPENRYRRAADALRDLNAVHRTSSSGLESSGTAPATGGFGSSPTLRFGERLPDDDTMEGDDGSSPTRVQFEPPTVRLEDVDETTNFEETLERHDSSQSWSSAGGDVERASEGASDDRVGTVPADWRIEQRRNLPSPLVGTGLGLFGLREAPFVDRDEERDAIWEALREVGREQSPRAIFITGESGSGKSRLVEWMASRADELGAAHIMKAVHGPGGESAGEGISGMVRRLVRGQKLDRNDFYEHLCEELPPLADESVDPEADARALCELVFPTDRTDENVDGPSYRFSTLGQKSAAVVRLIRRYRNGRPAFLWLDDAQWGAFAMNLIGYLVESPFEQPPVFVAATLRADVLSEKAWLRERVETLCERDVCTNIELDSLEPEDHREFVGRMLPLEERLGDRIARRTEGNPLFAVQLLGHLVEEGELEPSSSGFLLPDEGALDLPDDIHGIWMRRLGRFVASLDAENSDMAWSALERAAALGRELDDDEWREVCTEVGIARPDTFLAGLVGRGLAERTDEGWTFTHGLLVAALQRRARDEGRWREHNRKCVALLERLYPGIPARTAARRANHHIEAGEYEEAIDALMMEAKRLLRVGNIEEMTDVLERRAELFDELGVGNDDPRRIENDIERAHARHQLGAEPGPILEELKNARDRAEHRGRDDLVAEASHQAADCARGMGDLDAAREFLEEAIDGARNSEDRELLTKVLIRSGWLEYVTGHLEHAEQRLSEARDAAHEIGSVYWEAVARRGLGWVFMALGEDQTAAELLEGVLELSRDDGYRSLEAQALTGLGELARFREDVPRARHYYRQCRELFRELNRPLDATVAVINLAQVELMAGRFEEASEYLDEAERRIEELGRANKYAQIFPLCRLTHAAGVEDWSAFDRICSEYDDGWPEEARLMRDHPWILEMAGDYASEAGHEDRADRAWRLAADLWDRLDDAEAAGRVRAKRKS